MRKGLRGRKGDEEDIVHKPSSLYIFTVYSLPIERLKLLCVCVGLNFNTVYLNVNKHNCYRNQQWSHAQVRSRYCCLWLHINITWPVISTYECVCVYPPRVCVCVCVYFVLCAQVKPGSFELRETLCIFHKSYFPLLCRMQNVTATLNSFWCWGLMSVLMCCEICDLLWNCRFILPVPPPACSPQAQLNITHIFPVVNVSGFRSKNRLREGGSNLNRNWIAQPVLLVMLLKLLLLVVLNVKRYLDITVGHNSWFPCRAGVGNLFPIKDHLNFYASVLETAIARCNKFLSCTSTHSSVSLLRMWYLSNVFEGIPSLRLADLI